MRLLHYMEIENFKRFGERQRIELDHPAVLIGPNNCGKTSAIQALALWSQAVRSWYDARKDSSAKERTATPLNRLNIVSVPVQRTRFFWHNTNVRRGTKDIPLLITVGIQFENKVQPLTMRFRNRGDELVYCDPDREFSESLDLIEYAASLRIELLYPMSGLDTEEPILQPGRTDVLLGQGRTADVLRNLCLAVAKSSRDDWSRITSLMYRLFHVDIGQPMETTRGSITLSYRQKSVKDALDISSAGRGMLQMLLVFAYLFSHKRSVLLVDEPDAHLEILRQKQVYVLLRDIASENESQVVIVTHSEQILSEALTNNLTLLLDGQVDNVASRKDILNSLKHFGADHYVRARERGYVIYVEGGTDIAILRAFAQRLNHETAEIWDERINSFYVQNNYPIQDADAELERVEGGFGVTPREHFNGLRGLLPDLKGIAILDNDTSIRKTDEDEFLKVHYWKRYEAENYFITPSLLQDYAVRLYPNDDLFSSDAKNTICKVLDARVREFAFDGNAGDFDVWLNAAPDAKRLLWEARTERKKLSRFAEEFFEDISETLQQPVLLRKGEFHRLIGHADMVGTGLDEIRQKLDLLTPLFRQAWNRDEKTGPDPEV